MIMAMVVAHWAERSLITPEVRGSNPVVSTFLYRPFIYCQMYLKKENREKEARMPFEKN